ncbi:MAG: hypothetical protein ACYDBB_20870 [Armatimonadota bacterium]
MKGNYRWAAWHYKCAINAASRYDREGLHGDLANAYLYLSGAYDDLADAEIDNYLMDLSQILRNANSPDIIQKYVENNRALNSVNNKRQKSAIVRMQYYIQQSETAINRAKSLCDNVTSESKYTNTLLAEFIYTDLIELYKKRGKRYAVAESVLQSRLKQCEQSYGSGHYHTRIAAIMLMKLLQEQNKLSAAEPLVLRRLSLYSKRLDKNSKKYFCILVDTGNFYSAWGKSKKATHYYQLARTVDRLNSHNAAYLEADQMELYFGDYTPSYEEAKTAAYRK